MSSVVEELIEPRLAELEKRMDAMQADLGDVRSRMDAGFERIHQRIDEQGARRDLRLNGQAERMDEMAAQQRRMVEQLGSLKGGSDVANTLIRRIDRLEDRVFAMAG